MGASLKEMSLNDVIDKVRTAVYRAGMDEWGDSAMWVAEVFEDHAIVCNEKTGIHYRVGFTMSGDEVTVDDKDSWQEVEQEWVLKTLGPVIEFGGTIKTLDDNGKIGGLLVAYTDKNNLDLGRDFFTKDTDYDAKTGDPITIYYNHGLDRTIKRKKLGRGPGKLEFQDVGVWVEAQLDLRDEYEKAIFEMARAGKLGWSSGTLPNLVERVPQGKGFWIKTWPLGKDGSVTPTPAAGPILTQVLPLKTWAEATSSLQVTPSQDAGDASTRSSTTGTSNGQSTNRSSRSNTKMADKTPQEVFNDQLSLALKDWKVEAVDTPIGEVKDSVSALSQKVESIGDSVTKLVDILEKMPTSKKGGYMTDDGGTKDKASKSFGDFLVAVRRKDYKRLHQVYGSKAVYDPEDSEDWEVKDLSLEPGTAGGFLVPSEYAETLLQITPQASPILSRVQVIPVTRTSGDWPTLDQYITPSAGTGQTAFAGGVNTVITAPGGALTPTEPGFEMLQWRVHKIGGYTQVDNELISDSPMAIEALLRALFNVAVSAKHEYYILRGTGVGQPLGILNSTAPVLFTPTTNSLFSWADVGGMQARFKQVGTGGPAWLIHPSVWPDVLTMEVGTAGGAVWIANMQAAAGNTILGYPIVQSEHLPQANNSGNVILADLFAYLLFRRQEISVAFSEHAGFLNDKATWRFTARADGKPWVRQPITLADPQGSYTVSPFVVHND